MAVTLRYLAELLDELDLTYHLGESHIEIGFEMDTYRSPGGNRLLRMVLLVEEEGEYLKLFVPMALVAKGPHVDVFLRACAMMQWRTKLVQFEYDANDGEVRPMIEFPIEDGTVTARQLGRCVHGMVHLLDGYYEALERALARGEIDEQLKVPLPSMAAKFSSLELLEATLAALEQEGADPQLIAGLKLQIAHARSEREPPADA